MVLDSLLSYSNLLLAIIYYIYRPMFTIVHETALSVTTVNIWWTNLYFISFNLLATIMATNLLIAFILEAFWKQYANQQMIHDQNQAIEMMQHTSDNSPHNPVNDDDVEADRIPDDEVSAVDIKVPVVTKMKGTGEVTVGFNKTFQNSTFVF